MLQEEDDIRFEGGDGSTTENAIIIRGAHFDLAATYAIFYYMTQRFGQKDVDWKLIYQAHGVFNEKDIDTYAIKLADGVEKTLYFDITESFGKFPSL